METWTKVRVGIYAAFVAAQPLILFYLGDDHSAEVELWVNTLDKIAASAIGVLALFHIGNAPKARHIDDSVKE